MLDASQQTHYPLIYKNLQLCPRRNMPVGKIQKQQRKITRLENIRNFFLTCYGGKKNSLNFVAVWLISEWINEEAEILGEMKNANKRKMGRR